MLSPRRAAWAAIAATALLAGCSEGGTDLAPDLTRLKFSLDRCARGVDLTAGEGDRMPAGACLASPNGAYALLMQPSGTLELAPVIAGAPGKPVWTAGGRAAEPGSATAQFQSDGNLIVYERIDGPDTQVLWSSGSTAPLGDFHFGLTDQGELVIRDAAGQALWSSKTGLAAPQPAKPA